MPTLHSHTHWQAPQADTQTKACQRVCLSHAEKKKLKIPFPSKNFKNANPQTDTKTFGQLVAKLNKDKGCKTRTTRTPACNTGLAAMAGDVVNSTFMHLINFSAWGQVSASKPPLRQARSRWVQAYLTEQQTQTSRQNKPTHKWHIWFCPTHKPTLRKTKRAIFCQRTD